MKLSLVVETAGKWEGKTIPITLSQFLIGRDPQCHLRPASPLISKRHCAVLVRNGKAFIRDFDSTNGTFVNDQQIKGEVELKNKDHLKVGPLSFVVVMELPVPVDRPTPVPPTKAPVEGSDSDADAADLLMSMGDDGASAGLSSSDPVPEGSTVLDIMPVPPPGAGGAVKEKEKPKPAAPANTSTAAKAILEKYMRRPRT